MRADPPARRRWVAGLGAAAIGSLLLQGCDSGPRAFFTRLGDARRMAAELRLAFHRAADASNRAVMAESDEDSIRYAKEAEASREEAQRGVAPLLTLLRAAGWSEETGLLEAFSRSFEEYVKLDRTILSLAVENSNLKARSLAFGPARESAEAFRQALDALAEPGPKKNACQIGSLVYAAVLAVREIQVLLPQHIAESGEAAMDEMEKHMGILEASSRSALANLSGMVAGERGERLTRARAALDRFLATRDQIIALSRKNTNVRSLELSLGPKRAVIADCDVTLASLQEALGKKEILGTR